MKRISQMRQDTSYVYVNIWNFDTTHLLLKHIKNKFFRAACMSCSMASLFFTLSISMFLSFLLNNEMWQ